MTTQIHISVPARADYYAAIETEYLAASGRQPSTVYKVQPGAHTTVNVWGGVRITRIEERPMQAS